jgi:alkylated DNA nucleotide flippase Atl1
MASSRAEEVAELLWELKRAEKIAQFGEIAAQAGFSAGANGRAFRTTLKVVRRDWPHLQWWRAVSDDLAVERDSEQAQLLKDAGIELTESDDDSEHMVVINAESYLMEWEVEEDGEA